MLAESMVDSVGGVSSLGVDFEFDYFVDAISGDDTNNGMSATTPWATLSKINAITIPVDANVRIKVAKGVYSDALDYIDLSTAQASGATLDLVFDRGCEMDGTSASGYNGFEAPGTSAWTVNIYGNGLWVHAYKDATEALSPNGVGCRGNNVMNVYDVFVTDCNDGFSAHDASTLRLYRCLGAKCLKGSFDNVGTSKFEAYHCVFFGAVGTSSLGLGGNFGTGVHYLEDCSLIPVVALKAYQPKNTTHVRCRVGSLSTVVQLSTGTAIGGVFTDCFVNCYSDGNHILEFNRCFGKLTTRVRPGGSYTVTNSVMIGPATGQLSFVLGNYDFSGSSIVTVNNNIFSGNWIFDYVSTATYSDYIFAVGSEIKNNIFNGGVALSETMLVSGGDSISGTITDDPLIGSADSYKMTDYAFASSSPAIGAGSDGNDVGFSSYNATNRETDTTIKLSPEIVSGNDLSDYVLYWALWPELVLADQDNTLYSTTYTPNELDLSNLVNSDWLRLGTKMLVAYSEDQDADTIVKIDAAIGA
jgi:hypothetical protein